MTVVPLDRRFIAWTDKETGDPEVISYLLASQEALTWEDLLAKHRVVVLAEAGSGKSTELTRQFGLCVPIACRVLVPLVAVQA